MLINYQYDVPEAFVQLVEQYRVPAIWINNKREADCVYIDDYGGIRLAMERLLELGHKRIGFVAYDGWSKDDAEHHSHADRLRAYRDVMTECGLEPDLIGRPAGIDVSDRQAFSAA